MPINAPSRRWGLGITPCDVALQLATAGQHIALSYLFRAQRHGAGGGVVALEDAGFARAAHPGAAGGVDRQGIGLHRRQQRAADRHAEFAQRAGGAQRQPFGGIGLRCRRVELLFMETLSRHAEPAAQLLHLFHVGRRAAGHHRAFGDIRRRLPQRLFIDAAAEVAGLQIPLGHQRQAQLRMGGAQRAPLIGENRVGGVRTLTIAAISQAGRLAVSQRHIETIGVTPQPAASIR